MPPNKTKKPETKLAVVEAQPTYSFSDLERIIGICQTQIPDNQTPASQALVPKNQAPQSPEPTRFSGETLLGLTSRLGLDPNVVCRVMQEYAEGKYPLPEPKVKTSAALPKLPFYKVACQTIKEGVMSAGDAMGDLIIDVWDEHSTPIIVVGVIATVVYGIGGVIVPAINSVREAEKQSFLDRSEAVYKQDLSQTERDAQFRIILAEAIDYYDDANNLDSEELFSAANQYYTALQESKYTVTEGIPLLRVLGEHSYYTNSQELSSAASTYVQAVRERGMRLKESFSYLASVDEATSTSINAPQLVEAAFKLLGEPSDSTDTSFVRKFWFEN